MARHAQITQNNKFAISLQYLKKELSDEVDFLHADKHESLLQIDSIVLMGIDKHSQSSKNSKFASKFPTRLILSLLLGMTKPSQILIVTSFQYLYNISKKKLGMEVIFGLQINV